MPSKVNLPLSRVDCDHNYRFPCLLVRACYDTPSPLLRTAVIDIKCQKTEKSICCMPSFIFSSYFWNFLTVIISLFDTHILWSYSLLSYFIPIIICVQIIKITCCPLFFNNNHTCINLIFVLSCYLRSILAVQIGKNEHRGVIDCILDIRQFRSPVAASILQRNIGNPIFFARIFSDLYCSRNEYFYPSNGSLIKPN